MFHVFWRYDMYASVCICICTVLMSFFTKVSASHMFRHLLIYQTNLKFFLKLWVYNRDISCCSSLIVLLTSDIEQQYIYLFGLKELAIHLNKNIIMTSAMSCYICTIYGVCFSIPMSTHIAFLVLSFINKTDMFRCHVSKPFLAVSGQIKDLDFGRKYHN